MQFKLGDMVTWRSQAGATWKEKTGTVAEVVLAGARPNRDRFLSLYKGNGVGFARDHESYVIEVKPLKGRAASKFYWPRVAVLSGVASTTFNEPKSKELLRNFLQEPMTELKNYSEADLRAAVKNILGWSVVQLITQGASFSLTDLQTDLQNLRPVLWEDDDGGVAAP